MLDHDLNLASIGLFKQLDENCQDYRHGWFPHK